MTPEHWKNVSEALKHWFALPIEQRSAYLSQLQRDDAAQAAELQSLLDRYEGMPHVDWQALPSVLLDQFVSVDRDGTKNFINQDRSTVGPASSASNLD